LPHSSHGYGRDIARSGSRRTIKVQTPSFDSF
jgi:hypothetical protein